MAENPVSPEALQVLGEWRTETLIIVGIILLCGLVVYLGARYLEKRSEAKAKAAEAEAKVAAEEAKEARNAKFVGTVSEQNRVIRDLAIATGRMETSFTELSTTLKSTMATMRGVINPADSRKIIENELWIAAKETARAYQVSLRDNHFLGREREVQDKMLRATERLFDRALRKLQQFDMAVKPDNFFPKASGDGLRYDVIDKVWTYMERLYRTPVNYTDTRAAEERDRVVYDTITGLMRDEIYRGHRRADQIYSTSEHPSRVMEAPSDDDSSSNLSST